MLNQQKYHPAHHIFVLRKAACNLIYLFYTNLAVEEKPKDVECQAVIPFPFYAWLINWFLHHSSYKHRLETVSNQQPVMDQRLLRKREREDSDVPAITKKRKAGLSLTTPRYFFSIENQSQRQLIFVLQSMIDSENWLYLACFLSILDEILGL